MSPFECLDIIYDIRERNRVRQDTVFRVYAKDSGEKWEGKQTNYLLQNQLGHIDTL